MERKSSVVIFMVPIFSLMVLMRRTTIFLYTLLLRSYLQEYDLARMTMMIVIVTRGDRCCYFVQML